MLEKAKTQADLIGVNELKTIFLERLEHFIKAIQSDRNSQQGTDRKLTPAELMMASSYTKP